MCSAEKQDVAEAFEFAVHAFDAIVVGWAAEEGEGKVNFLGDALHGGKDEFLEAGLDS